ncbi:transcriptional repressor [Mactra antiquata]
MEDITNVAVNSMRSPLADDTHNHNVCNICDKKFSARKHLLRHQRTVHDEVQKKECQVCYAKFNRVDNNMRHIKTHTRKRRCTESNISSPYKKPKPNSVTSEDSDSGPSMSRIETGITGKCIWCTRQKQLLPGKPFCNDCAKNGRECRWCHRPLPERFYSKRTDVCDTCINRRERFYLTRLEELPINVHWMELQNLKHWSPTLETCGIYCNFSQTTR